MCAHAGGVIFTDNMRARDGCGRSVLTMTETVMGTRSSWKISALSCVVQQYTSSKTTRSTVHVVTKHAGRPITLSSERY